MEAMEHSSQLTDVVEWFETHIYIGYMGYTGQAVTHTHLCSETTKLSKQILT